MKQLKTRPQQGFTLIEMSIVILLMASIVSTVAVIFANTLERLQLRETNAKIKIITDALYQYRVAFNELPCPADITLAIDSTQFGEAAANKGTCTGGLPAANFTGTGTAERQMRGGMIPTRTLQLSDDMAFDGWGRRFFYFVTRDLTQEGAMNVISGVNTDSRITILNEQGVSNTDLAAYVLLSTGPNGHGAYPRVGGTSRINTFSVNADELNNCDCTATATSSVSDEIFVQKDPDQNPANLLDAFDDILVYATRQDMMLQSTLSWTLGPQFSFITGGGADLTGAIPGGGPAGGAGPGGGEDLPVVCSGGKLPAGCFPAGTMISTPEGPLAIETLDAGQEVYAVGTDGMRIAATIRGTIHKQEQLLEIHTKYGVLRVTSEHPIWMGGDEYREAHKILVGDEIMMWHEGEAHAVPVTDTTYPAGEMQDVYNLDVDTPNTFIANDVIVHNKTIAFECYTTTLK